VSDASGQFDGYYGILLATAIAQNAAYIFISIKEFDSYKKQYHDKFSNNPTNQYLKTILTVMMICLGL